MLAFAALLAVHAGLAGSIPSAPENITVTFLTPTSVRVSWQTSMDPHTMPVDKYDVTYKPTDASYRVVVVVAGNREAVTLGGLSPDTQYQLTVAAVWNGKKYRSRPIVFRTLEPPRTSFQQDSGALAGNSGPPISPHADTAPSLSGFGIFSDEFGNISTNSTSRNELPTIRGVEIGIVVLVLIVWAGAIALFFNRWGKIRMLLPYQPDYKQEQLKVPGTGVCANGTCNGQHSHQENQTGLEALAKMHLQQPYHPWPEEPSSVISERCTRARINSAIFVSSEGRGFDSIEFIRRYGSQSVLCRKARSAENVSASERQRRFSEYPEWESEENKQYGKMNGYEHCGPDGASNTNAEPRQDSIELVECHREPGSSTTANQPVTVTPAVVVLPLPVGGSSSKCCASASGGCNGSSSGAGDYVCLDGHHSKTTPKLSNLPTLSVSGPSPPHEEEFFQYSPPLENGPEKERY
ncbi:uncharacterized protein LOC6035628 isoform X1 [Culex quinquefasciatus]|uniref:uncharacterized protein LOC6035628 isoform X1 n=1 Tax=Culex quinquefasciatus TaxID=7176 RepID=UPI0018E3E766|nr:uncharacterized protein LOC6035628 isoform X1 [Culex quinquefasciatus]XP_038118307.1 uncharacterized protein LOC6035628 isoform X1 [Culex quinquefasciatus]